MSVLLTALQVVVGKTRAVPLGVLALVAIGLVLRAAVPDLWADVGAIVLVLGVAAVLTAALPRGR